MDAATIATTVVAFLSPYLVEGGKAVIGRGVKLQGTSHACAGFFLRLQIIYGGKEVDFIVSLMG